MGGKSSSEYFRRYNAKRTKNYYQEAKNDPDRWQRVLDARTRSDQKRQAATKENPVAWVAHNLKQTAGRCRRAGIPFNLTLRDIVVVTHCPITGDQINYGCRGRPSNGPSFDRIRPELGYTAGNVRIISRFANLVRQNCTDAKVFRALAEDAERLFGNE